MTLKRFVKLCIAILVIGLFAPFFITGPDGKKLMHYGGIVDELRHYANSAELKWLQVRSSVNDLARETGDREPKQPVKVYRWRDAEGRWQFSDEPNPAGASESFTIDPELNVIQSTPLPVEKKQPDVESNTAAPQTGVPLPFTVPLDQAAELKQDAEKLKELLEQRYKSLEELSGDKGKEDYN